MLAVVAAGALLNIVDRLQQLPRSARGGCQHDGVEEIRRILRHSPCLGAIQRRHAGDLRALDRIKLPDGVTQHPGDGSGISALVRTERQHDVVDASGAALVLIAAILTIADRDIIVRWRS